MNYVSLFSGIEAASVAWAPLGWTALAFSEIEPFCCDLLFKRFPDVPNLGDISHIDWSAYAGAVDLVIGGSPCQSFSVAGQRKGLLDERGQLMLEYVRAIRDLRPSWFIWENVPGVLSQSDGDAFETLQRELEQCGYSMAWRVLDSQYFGVAQRRRRVFLVGHFGTGGGYPAAVLFERESMRWDFATGAEKRKALTDHARDRSQVCDRQSGSETTDSVHGAIGFSAGQSAQAGSVAAQEEVAPTLRAGESGTNQVPTVCYAITMGHTTANGSNVYQNVSPTLDHSGSPCAVCMTDTQTNGSVEIDMCGTLTAHSAKDTPIVLCLADDNGKAALEENMSGTLKVGGSQPIICLNDQGGSRMEASEDMVGTLRSEAHGNNPIVSDGYVVRRLTPTECERLQGFPDGWTDLGGASDAVRYKALGNSMAVPVIRWIGQRIDAVDQIARAGGGASLSDPLERDRGRNPNRQCGLHRGDEGALSQLHRLGTDRSALRRGLQDRHA